MTGYLLRRLLYSIPLLIVISLISFTVITLPPGDYMTFLQTELTQRAHLSVEEAKQIADDMRERYGLDEPFLNQYFSWFVGLFRGDFGYSFNFHKPVFEVIWTRLGWTFLIAITCYFFSLIFGLLPGIYSATHQYSLSDNIFTFFSFLGLSIPNFFLALALMYILVYYAGAKSIGGLFSPDMVMEPWGWAKFVDFLKHFWLPVIVVGTAGTARNMRVMRGNLLDIIGQPYIQTARSKGLKEGLVIYKHALKNAIQPIVMQFGMTLPWLIQGAMVSSVVLNLPTTGPVFLEALQSQDMYLAGSFLMMIAVLTIIGNILADIILASLDPRVRYD